ncbi:MAG TPA: ECF transporter S component [Methanocella sp.]|nr:ECF transporter S component [Methanocella sp.]
MAEKYYFSTKNLLTIAILSLLGAILSTYVGYVGQTFGSLTGIPFGGQLLSGMHIFWLVLVLVLVDKKGSGVLAGTLDNIVQFLLGSHMGIYVLPVGIMQGVFAELGYWPLKKYRTLSLVISGGLSSFANVLVMQVLLNRFGDIYIFGTISIFAFVSGMVLGGCLVIGIVRILQDAGVVSQKDATEKKGFYSLYKVTAIVLVCAFILLATANFVLPQTNSTSGGATTSYMINVTDSSGHMKKYDVVALKSNYVTINATFKGAQSSYTGIPVSYLLKDSDADKSGTSVTITGNDGYSQAFTLSEITGNNLVLYPSNKTYSLAASGYSPQQWIRDVVSIKVS